MGKALARAPVGTAPERTSPELSSWSRDPKVATRSQPRKTSTARVTIPKDPDPVPRSRRIPSHEASGSDCRHPEGPRPQSRSRGIPTGSEPVDAADPTPRRAPDRHHLVPKDLVVRSAPGPHPRSWGEQERDCVLRYGGHSARPVPPRQALFSKSQAYPRNFSDVPRSPPVHPLIAHSVIHSNGSRLTSAAIAD